MNLPPGRFVKGGKGAGREYMLDACPGCGKKHKFHWNVFKLEGVCFYCGMVIKGWKKFREVFPLLEEDPTPAQKTPTLTGPQSLPPDTVPAHSHTEARAYLLSRRVSEERIRDIEARYHELTKELYFPLRSVDPELPQSWIKRRISPEGHWVVAPGTTRSRYAYGWDWIPRTRSQVIIVEGVFDVLGPGLLGYAMATLGTTLSTDLLTWINNRFRHVWLWYDPGEAGDKGRKAVTFALRAWGISHSVLRTDTDPGSYRDEKVLDGLRKKVTLNITDEHSSRSITTPSQAVHRHR